MDELDPGSEPKKTSLQNRAYPHMDGSRGARALFGSGVWSVAAMYTASRLRHDLPRALMKSAGLDGSRSMARGLRRTGPNWVSWPSFLRLYAITSRRASPFRCRRTRPAAISFSLSPAWLGSCRRGR